MWGGIPARVTEEKRNEQDVTYHEPTRGYFLSNDINISIDIGRGA